jgi:hypothetical protein
MTEQEWLTASDPWSSLRYSAVPLSLIRIVPVSVYLLYSQRCSS